MAVGARPQVVVLVPGFLDFERGQSVLFAGVHTRFSRSLSARPGLHEDCRVAGVLRAALEAHSGLPVPVVTLPVCKASDLAARQRVLLRHLETLDGSLRGVRQFHLVGHGPGGVDAELLTQAFPLKTGATWNDLDPSHLRERIASVTTIASPHYGTQLADQPLIASFRRPQSLDAQGLRQAVRVGTSALREFVERFRKSANLRHPGWSSVALLGSLLREKQLVRELSSHSMQALRAYNAPDPTLSVRVQSIVVTAPDVTLEQAGVLRLRDNLFAALHSLTALRSVIEPSLPLSHAQRVLRNVAPERVVRHPTARVPAFDLGANDGFVNAVRQLLMTRGHQDSCLAAVVIADHADVIGYYDQSSMLAPEVCKRAGLLRSGANFGDDEFFQLWGLVAARIAELAVCASDPAEELPDLDAALSSAEVAAQ